jgi:hypothetical protein
MIKLRLTGRAPDFASVQSLPGLVGLKLDPAFGLILISPRDGLYVVRAESVDDLNQRRLLSPEIIEAYGDTRISST